MASKLTGALKRVIFSALFFLILSLTVSNLYAQNTEYYVERRFIQRLTWSGDEYASRYEVIVQRADQNTYTTVVQETTNNFYIEVSLTPGNYRYRVIPYDYLGKPSPGSQWIEFTILLALPPELYEAKYEFDMADKDSQFVININGKNIEKDAKIYLRAGSAGILHPKETGILPDGSGALLVFESINLIPGNFLIIVENPNGLQASMAGSFFVISSPDKPVPVEPDPVEPEIDEPGFEEIEIEEPKPKKPPVVIPLDLFLTAAWMPVINTFGEMDWLLDQTSFDGVIFRIGIVNNNSDLIRIGVEVAGSVLSNSDGTQIFALDFNLLARKWTFDNKQALNFRFGVECNSLNSFDTQNVNAINTGISLLMLLSKNIYIEAGVDSVYWLVGNVDSGGLRPWIGAGVRF